MTGGGEGAKREGNKGRSPPYIEGNPNTAFAAPLIPQYQSHIRVTKETIQFVVNLAKEIPHSNRVTKERTPKLSQHVSHQGTMRLVHFVFHLLHLVQPDAPLSLQSVQRACCDPTRSHCLSVVSAPLSSRLQASCLLLPTARIQWPSQIPSHL